MAKFVSNCLIFGVIVRNSNRKILFFGLIWYLEGDREEPEKDDLIYVAVMMHLNRNLIM
jgi:hypothetical protein